MALDVAVGAEAAADLADLGEMAAELPLQEF